MAKPLLRFTRVGGHISIQDLGRRHAMHTGFTEGGAMDLHAFYWSNRLLERHYNAPVFEITLGNAEIEFAQDCQIALTGADLDAKINGASISSWRTYLIRRQDILSFGLPKNGLRAYLAINAELKVNRQFGSTSTVLREQKQGVGTQLAIVTGVSIEAEAIAGNGFSRAVPSRFVPDYATPLTLALISGYQFEQFPRDAIDCLLNSSYKVGNNSNRMAYTLEGAPVDHEIQALASEGIAHGAVQIPPDGQPVVLLNDRQTMGGYPKVGCVSRLSCSALSQRMGGAEVRFTLTSLQSARSELSKLQRFHCQ